ncbi:hypothetical protein [Bradyrhizobium erythrophlei]|jgi:hypothetical protein|uniref:Uncharacterized protein n=1 Tax=Bradyrhizobium erythrophlei TaxID=1437360 RepID=A0A1M7UFU1_9BRAD|nr:hypothetical protein [Bradyrhizobium erythrophlei]SHN81796.1 hypothetical protein SAMN05444170_4909 [Bradyrhizobium erythrophlei]
MIDDMASLKHAMEQMDSDDPAVAQAARDRAAQILSNAGLSFAKIAELIEERRLLLRPRIVASIKRMDQPDGLGDAAFRDTGASLRKEGQSFRQIAEALELGGHVAPRYEKAVHSGLHQVELENERDVAESRRDPALVSYLLRFLVIAGLGVVLVYALHEFAAGSWHFPGYRAGLGAARQRADVTPPVSPGEPAPSASPSTGSATPSAPPAATVAPSANEPTPAQPSPAASANPPAASPPPSTPPVANDRPRTAQSRTYNDFMPDRIRRKSRYAGPCMGGVGGCYWGGGQY